MKRYSISLIIRKTRIKTFVRWLIMGTIMVFSFLLWSGELLAAQQSEVTPGILKFSPNLSAAELAKRPDTDLIELSNGRRISLGAIRQLRERAQKLRANTPNSRLPKAFTTKPAATGMVVSNSSDLAAALKLSDDTTVVLPSGKRITVRMLRFLQPEIERQLGRSLMTGAEAPKRVGPAIQVNRKTNWKEILQKPDDTILESPNGKRITVGELKRAFGISSTAQPLPSMKPSSVVPPVKK